MVTESGFTGFKLVPKEPNLFVVLRETGGFRLGLNNSKTEGLDIRFKPKVSVFGAN